MVLAPDAGYRCWWLCSWLCEWWRQGAGVDAWWRQGAGCWVGWAPVLVVRVVEIGRRRWVPGAGAWLWLRQGAGCYGRRCWALGAVAALSWLCA